MDKEFDWLKGDRLSSIDAFSFAETEDLFGLLELAEKVRDKAMEEILLILRKSLYR